MELSKQQLQQVKSILDAANWFGEASHPDRVNEQDAEKACRYLNRQRFSVKAIREHTDGLDVVDVYERADGEVDNVPQVVAAMIADSLAMDRVRRFLYHSKRLPGHGWYLPESWVFLIGKSRHCLARYNMADTVGIVVV